MTRQEPVVRVGRIDYLNTLPFYIGLEEAFRPSRLELVNGVPAELNKLLRRGALDVAPVSSLEYALGAGRYELFGGGCIATVGAARSVRVFSKYPLEDLDGKTVALSRESLTSATLLKIILAFKYGFTNVFRQDGVSLNEMLASADAALVIGDRALEETAGPGLYVYDLGLVWNAWQGVPFCFALWVATKHFMVRDPDITERLRAALETSLDRNLDDLEGLVARAYGSKPLPLKREEVIDYLENLSYRLNPAIREGLNRFFTLAARLGVLEAERQPLAAASAEKGSNRA